MNEIETFFLIFSLKPETVESIIEIIPLLDFGLIMTVSPGFGCQKLRHECLETVKILRNMNSNRKIEVDVFQEREFVQGKSKQLNSCEHKLNHNAYYKFERS